MSGNTKWLSLLLIPLMGIMTVSIKTASAADSLTIYTPYTRISVSPGESINYTIEAINNSKEVINTSIGISGLPQGWKHTLRSGTFNVSQIAVLPGKSQDLLLNVEVPVKVPKGTYRFRVVAGEYGILPLAITIAEQGTYKSELTSKQANMEGHASSNFNFNTVLANRTAEKQLYALMANAPAGWVVTFKPNYVQATSVEIVPNGTQEIQVDIDPPANVEAGTYKIPVSAGNSITMASLDLEVVIKGTFGIELTTPLGLLSAKITAGKDKRIELIVRNTGSSMLNDISMSAAAPSNWEVKFEPDKIAFLEPGKVAQVFATLRAERRAIAGDYVTNFDAKTAESSSRAAFRISVKTPMLVGWIGILVILASLGSIWYLFKKYGRR
jgi:uncharacterized membrane protein